MQLGLTAARAPPSGTQPEITTHVATPAKPVRVRHCEHIGQRDQCSHTFDLFDLFQQSYFGVDLCGDFFNAPVTFRNPLVQRFDSL